MNELQLGCTVKDKITGFEGVVTGIVDYLSGCNQALVVPKVDKDGKLRDAHWFDVQRLTVADAELMTHRQLHRSLQPGRRSQRMHGAGLLHDQGQAAQRPLA